MNNLINNNCINLQQNDSIENLNYIYNTNDKKSLKIPFYFENKMNTVEPKDSLDLHKIFSNSIKHILLVKPYLYNINKKVLKKMEFEFLKEDLNKQGININYLLNGCLDSVKNIIFEN